MSGETSISMAAVSPTIGPVHLFLSPVDRGGSGPRVFDPARQGRFALAAPPAGWFSAGPLAALEREDTGEFVEVWSGTPAVLSTRARGTSGAQLRFRLGAWSKAAMALSSGSQQMNLLRTATGFTPANSGGTAESVPVLSGSTETAVRVPAGFAVSVGDGIAVDEDYAGQTGFVGSPLAGTYVADPARVGNDAEYLRRITFNLARVAGIAGDATAQTLTLSEPLPAGPPAGTMRVSAVQGFVDRVGGTWLSEWSALLVADGVAGDRVLLHYPRLQAAPGPTEARSPLSPDADTLERWQLQANLVALPVTDGNDGDAVLCYRSYLPAPGRPL